MKQSWIFESLSPSTGADVEVNRSEFALTVPIPCWPST